MCEVSVCDVCEFEEGVECRSDEEKVGDNRYNCASEYYKDPHCFR